MLSLAGNLPIFCRNLHLRSNPACIWCSVVGRVLCVPGSARQPVILQPHFLEFHELVSFSRPAIWHFHTLDKGINIWTNVHCPQDGPMSHVPTSVKLVGWEGIFEWGDSHWKQWVHPWMFLGSNHLCFLCLEEGMSWWWRSWEVFSRGSSTFRTCVRELPERRRGFSC